jgi:hypothetical protein
MSFDAPEPSTNVPRRILRAGLLVATALIAGVGFAFLADSNGGGGVRMEAVTEVPYTAHLNVAPRADRLPKAQQAAPVTAREPGEDAAFAELVERALAETEATRTATVAPRGDFGATPGTPVPIPVARPEPPAPAIAHYDEPDGYLVPLEPIPQHEYVAEESERRSARRKAGPIDALGLPFEIVGRTVASFGNAVASIGKPDRRY